MNRTRTLVFALLLTACKTTGSGPAAISEWIPFDATQGSIKFDVLINGARTRAMLDSGASISLISKDFCETNDIGRSGQNIRVQGAFGSSLLNFADPFTVDFVGEEGPGGAVRIQDAIISDRAGSEVDLILGIQFFRRLVVQIDYPRHQFRYMTSNATNLETTANTSMKTMPNQTLLLVSVEVGEKSRWVMLDTGNTSALYLPRRTAQQEGWIRNSAPAGATQAAGVVKDVTLERRLLQTLKIGPYALADVPIIIQTVGEGVKNRPQAKLGSRITSTLNPTEPGILGYDVLRHFVVTIDHDRELMHLLLP